jgi:hypothetical protein
MLVIHDSKCLLPASSYEPTTEERRTENPFPLNIIPQ